MYSSIPKSLDSRSKSTESQQSEIIRKSLGLPEIDNQKIDSETYHSRISKIREIAESELNLSNETIKLIDTKKNPDQILESLQSRSKSLSQEALNVWGIESPSQVLLKYGEGQYLFPPSTIANILTHATSLVFLLWLASFQMTRQRELMIIKTLRGLDSVFPHIINVFPVNYSQTGVNSIDNKKYKKRSSAERWVEQYLPLLVRGMAALLFPLPIASALVYSLVELHTSINQGSSAGASYLFVFCIWSGFTILLLTLQEYLIPKDKEFYA